MKIPIYISQCPNDTIALWAWQHHLIPAPLEIELHLYDIHKLNELAMAKTKGILKVSCGVLHELQNYHLLEVGLALGDNCGPLVVCHHNKKNQAYENLRWAIPGYQTTAAKLLGYFFPKITHLVQMRYDQIVPAIMQGDVDAGVIIHETRFTLEKKCHIQADLGKLWKKATGLATPLGCQVASPTLTHEITLQYSQTWRRSLEYGLAHIDEAMPWLQTYSEEKSPEIIKKHIELYVNQNSTQMDSKALLAIQELKKIPSKQNKDHAPTLAL